MKNDRTYRSICSSISEWSRKADAPVETLKEIAAESELQNEVLFCPQLELFVDFDLQKDNQTCSETNNGVGARAHSGEKRGGEGK